MKWLVIVLGSLAALALLVAVVGSLLPRDHVATRRVRLKPAPPAVWEVLADHAAEPSWRKDVVRVERMPDRDGRPVWQEVTRGGDTLAFVTEESVPPRRLVRRIVGEGLPFGGTWTLEIAPEGLGSVVTLTERGEVYNPVFRFVSRFVMGHTATMDAYLKALGKRFGEDAIIQ
jgi:hypothetical protein